MSLDINPVDDVNSNETYLLANPDSITDICRYMNNELNLPLISMFANDERSINCCFAVYYTFADRSCGRLIIIKILLNKSNPVFKSISADIPAASLYEREINDMFGIVPSGHPNLKNLVFHGNWPDDVHPLRKDLNLNFRPPHAERKTRFDKVTGEGVFEIPVGPVHAGIIEPGHFRFSVAGEPVINLEAQLYFVHKGIEKLCESASIEKCLYISERISGDESFTNSLAYCLALEKIAGIDVPERAQYTRVVFAELERLTSHLGDLAGICLDTAYGFAGFQFRMMRGWAYLIADELCSMRFLRSVNKPGGVRCDFIKGKETSVIGRLRMIRKELTDTTDIILSNNMFVDRVENTGILQKEIAADLNATGPGGRASGIRYDVRKAFPYAAYGLLDFKVPKHNNGDVNCRMKMKLEECVISIDMMINILEMIPGGRIIEPLGSVTPYKYAFGMTESPRGENVHWVMTGENDTIFRYKIRTASFCNWPALCHAVKGNVIPDFPLINKSFNLSYAGNDL
ncbi:MAG: hydrogenase large subunit [Saccharofermentanales bacterium]